MKRVYYKSKPEKFEKTRNGVFIRLDIKEDNREDSQSFSALEFFISCPVTENKVFEKIMTNLYGNDFENKLINEYTSAKLELYEPDICIVKIVNYKKFLSERIALKQEVENICNAHDII